MYLVRGEGPHVLVATAAALAEQLIHSAPVVLLVLFLEFAHHRSRHRHRRRRSPPLRVGALDVCGDALGRLEGGGALGTAVRDVATE